MGNATNKIKKYADLSRKLGKLAIQIKDDYYINWKNAKTRKIYDNVHLMCVFSNGINHFLKAERAPKITGQPVSVSTLQTMTKNK